MIINHQNCLCVFCDYCGLSINYKQIVCKVLLWSQVLLETYQNHDGCLFYEWVSEFIHKVVILKACFFFSCLVIDGISQRIRGRPGAEGCSWPKLWLHVQAADYRQQQRGKDLFLVPLCRWLLHFSIRQHSGHWLQSQDNLQEWQASQATDLGKMETYTEMLITDICWIVCVQKED